ncbi:hypothetical protein QBC35DRAFT_481090 [Podospora australis]|uniref:DUF3752 domain-containing protein n=1 Tax=Podospora australis TaxID=1536484 RepID=A0AAN6X3J8_9PEZI|nr:hypothetical protein QBC35DRAFT_481090 [Podospora australis]
MSSIGPQLPPHLQKRKRTPEHDEQPNSPPTKVTRRDNTDEINLEDSDSDDAYGPSLPSKSKPSIGPSLPPSNSTPQPRSAPPIAKPSIGPSLPPAPSTNQDEIPLDDSDSDSDSDGDYGPRPPPQAKALGPQKPPSPPRRILGPAPPPADLSERPPGSPNSDSDSDSEDGWGPSLPGAAPSRPSSYGPSLPSTTAPPAPKRDDWMIAPPTSSGPRAPDPTKLKNRKFNTGPRAATEAKAGGISSIWTETPEEKARRLANAVLGREDPNNSATGGGSSSAANEKRGKYTAEDEAQIRAYTEQTRGKSLVEQHQERKAEAKRQRGGEFNGKEEDDDPSKRAFDWEKDMKVGGSISGSDKKQILNKAANFGGRFQKGSYL